jgi:hypothetical protein
MPKLKITNLPMVSFLTALVINALIFGVNWEPVVQGHAETRPEYILRSLLYVLGIYTFYWSYCIAKQKRAERWKYMSQIAITLGILWLAFMIYALILGYYWGKAWQRSNLQF